jgi:hypothetical protein
MNFVQQANLFNRCLHSSSPIPSHQHAPRLHIPSWPTEQHLLPRPATTRPTLLHQGLHCRHSATPSNDMGDAQVGAEPPQAPTEMNRPTNQTPGLAKRMNTISTFRKAPDRFGTPTIFPNSGQVGMACDGHMGASLWHEWVASLYPAGSCASRAHSMLMAAQEATWQQKVLTLRAPDLPEGQMLIALGLPPRTHHGTWLVSW